MTKEEFDTYMHTNLICDTYIVRIKMKYTCEKNYTFTNEVLDCCNGFWEWLNDWWEGQQEVEILGCIPLRDVNIPDFIYKKEG